MAIVLGQFSWALSVLIALVFIVGVLRAARWAFGPDRREGDSLRVLLIGLCAAGSVSALAAALLY